MAFAPFTTTWILLHTALLGPVAPSRAIEPVIQVEPDCAMVDEVVRVHAAGLAPGQTATIRAAMRDSRGREWRSKATYLIDEHGRIDVGRQAPISGTYKGVDKMGLFWSMALPQDLPEEEVRPAIFSFDVDKPATARVEVWVMGKAVAHCSLTRLFMKPEVRVEEVRSGGMVGALYVPPGAGPHPALLVLSGSNGGMERGEAALLASHGFAAFALAYFREDGLPPDLVNIRLEYLKKGLDWLARHDAIDPQRIGAFGGSKGAELSLLLACRYPKIRAVVGYMPSHVVWQGISMSGSPPDAPSWSYHGKPLDFVHVKNTAGFYWQLARGQPLRLVGLYEAGLEDRDEVKRAVIPVERINGPILLISGADDQLWPSTLMAEKIMERLKQHRHPYADIHLRYEKAGHGIGMSYLPALASGSRSRLAFGGTEEATAHAQADSWPKVLAFLNRNLGKSRPTTTDRPGESPAPRP